MRTGTKSRRKSRTVTSAVITPEIPLKPGPNAPQCPNCRLITPRSLNSMVNAALEQFYDCKCGTRVTVPAVKGYREADI